MSTAFEQRSLCRSAFMPGKGREPSSGRSSRAPILFWLWLAFMREHLAAIVSVTFLVPMAMSMSLPIAAVLVVLGVIYLSANIFAFRHTIGQQAEVERYHRDLTGRVGDVLGNVTVVQSFTRLEAEATALKDLMRDLLAAPVPGPDLVGRRHRPDACRIHRDRRRHRRARCSAGPAVASCRSARWWVSSPWPPS
jgi:ATP-binding cassette subfamily B protein